MNKNDKSSYFKCLVASLSALADIVEHWLLWMVTEKPQQLQQFLHGVQTLIQLNQQQQQQTACFAAAVPLPESYDDARLISPWIPKLECERATDANTDLCLLCTYLVYHYKEDTYDHRMLGEVFHRLFRNVIGTWSA